MDPLRTGTFRQRLRFLHESEYWTEEALRCHQLRELQALVSYACASVPFYRNAYRSLGIRPAELRRIEDIRDLPAITKQEIQAHHESFTPEGVDRHDLFHRSTGGSTGTPLTVLMDLDHIAKDKANTEYYMNVAGLSIFDYRSVRLYGDKLPEDVLERRQYWHVVDSRKLVMSCYHVTRQTAPLYVSAIDDFQPRYIHSRPSAIYPLAKQIAELGLKITTELSGIFLDGEVLTDGQRGLIEQAFGCRVFPVYGHTEGCCVGFSCPESRYLHFMPQVGILELLREDGSWADGEGEKGEMVVTGFNNRMFPLIRYRTGDIGVNTSQTCPCGRHYPMLARVEGRVQDYAISRDGVAVPLAPAVFNYNDMDWRGIRQFQVQQRAEGRLNFRVVREPSASETAEAMKARLLERFGRIFGGTFDLSLEYVKEIPRTRIGKFRYLDQQLDMSRYSIAS